MRPTVRKPLIIAILAGGLATRLRPVTEKIPKSLVPVAGKPFLTHQLELLQSRGIRREPRGCAALPRTCCDWRVSPQIQ